MADEGAVVGEAWVKLRPSLASFASEAAGSIGNLLGPLSNSFSSVFTKAGTQAKTLAGDVGAISPEVNSLAGALSGPKGLAAALIAVTAISGKMASDFQSQMEMLATQAGVSQNKIAGLSNGVLDLSAQVGIGPTSLAEALFHVESTFEKTGLTGKQTMDILRTAAEGARVGQANLVDVTNAMDAAVVSGIPGVENYQQAMGALNATVGIGDMTMQDLAEALSTGVLAVIKGYGVTLKDASAALAVFGDNNIRGASAGTQLRMAVQSLVVPTMEGKKNLEALGLQSDTLAKDMQHGGLNQALLDLNQHLSTAGITGNKLGEWLTETFGKRAGVGVNVLVGQLGLFREALGRVDDASKGFGEAWARTQETTKQKIAEAKAAFDALAIRIGIAVLPAINILIEGFTILAKVLTIVLTPAIKAITDVLSWIKVAISGISSIFAHAASVIKTSFNNISPDLSSGPIKKFNDFFAAIGSAAKRGVDSISSALNSSGISPLVRDIQTALADVKLGFEGVVPDLSSGPIKKFDAFFAAVGLSARQAAAAVKKIGDEVSTGFSNPDVLTGKGLGKLEQSFFAIGQTAGKVAKEVTVFSQTIVAAFSGKDVIAKNPVQQIAEGIGDMARFITTTALPAIETVVSFLNNQFAGVIKFVITEMPAFSEAITHAFNVAKDFALPILITLAVAIKVATEAIVLATKITVGIIQALWHAAGDDVLRAVQTAWTAIKEVISGTLTVIENVIKLVLDLINGDWSKAWGDLTKIVSAAWQILSALLKGAAGLVKEALGAVVSIVAGIFAELGKLIVLASIQLVEYFAQLNLRLLKVVATAAQWLVTAGTQVLIGFLQGLIVGLVLVKTWLVSLPEQLLSAAYAGGYLVGLFVKPGWDIITGLFSGMQDAWNLGVKFFTDLPNNIVGFFSSAGSWLTKGGSDTIHGYIDSIALAAQGIWNWLNTLPVVIQGYFIAAINWLFKAGQDLVLGLLNGVTAAAQALWNWLAALPGLVITSMANAGSWLQSAGIAIVSGFVASMQHEMHQIVDWLRAIPGVIRGLFSDAGTWLVDAGNQIVSGIVTGIRRGSNAVVDELKNVAHNAIKGFTDAIKPGSPSRVFTQLAQTIPQGVAKGIKTDSHLVVRSMKELTADVLSGFTASPLSPRTQNLNTANAFPHAITGTTNYNLTLQTSQSNAPLIQQFARMQRLTPLLRAA